MFKQVILATMFFFSYYAFAQHFPFGFWRGPSCPNIGDVCSDGTIFAGTFDGGKYYITPSGCNDSSTPTCAGGTDTVQKKFIGNTGSDSDIPGVEQLDNHADPSSSAYRGHVTTPIIAAHSSVSSDSAADFCNDMVFGGHSDWYLGSKSEMTHIYCKSNGLPPDPGFPQSAVSCTSMGGKTSELTGFVTTAGTNYLTSTGTTSSGQIWRQDFNNGDNDISHKNLLNYVRCMRRK